MHPKHITGMLHALEPALKSRTKARQLLESYWRDRMAIVWELTSVHRAANEREVALTDEEARQHLKELHHHHNPQYGVRWEDLTSLIEGDVLGRKLTQAELKRFLEQDVITINK